MRNIERVVVNFIFFLLIMISLMGSINNLLNLVTQDNPLSILAFDCMLVIAFVLFWNKSRLMFVNWIKVICNIICKRKFYLILFLFLIVTWQVYLVFTISGFSIWDPGIIILRAINITPWVGNDYFSYYPNTFLLLILEHIIWHIMGTPTLKVLTYTLNVVNYIFLDLSLIIAYIFLKKVFNSFAAKFYFVTGMILVALTPWPCIPYSDVIALCLSTLTLVVLYLFKENYSFKKNVLISIECGILIAFDYLIKPSLLIVFIAFVFATLILFFDTYAKRKYFVKYLILLCSFFLCVGGAKFIQSNNHFVSIDSRKSFSLFHFAAMGIEGNGGYSLKDVNRDIRISNPTQRKKDDIKVWSERLKKKGVLKYQSFLIKKQCLNTDDATFGWGQDGIFLKPFMKNYTWGQKLFMVNKSAQYNGFVAVILQVIWVIMYCSMLFIAMDKGFIAYFLKIAFIGFCLFLLLFEGGRSRYVIQFLPICIMLSSLGMLKVRKILK